jgi:hypothetical protein
MHATSPWFDPGNIMWWYKSWSFSYSFTTWCYSLPRRPRYHSQHPILDHAQPLFHRNCEQPRNLPLYALDFTCSCIKDNSGNVERYGRNWRILYYPFTTIFFFVVYLICRILGSAVLIAVLSFKWWLSFIVYTLSVLGLFCCFRGTLLLHSSELLNLVQVNAEVIGRKKILQLYRKFWGNSGW